MLGQQAVFLHHSPAAHPDGFAVDHGAHAAPGNFLHRIRGRGQGAPGGICLQRLGDGVGAAALGRGGQGQQAVFLPVDSRYLLHGEHTAGEGAGFIEHRDLGMAEGLEIIAALYQHSHARGAADPAEKAEGHRDDQGTGARYHQEGQRPVQPVPEHLPRDQQRRHRGQQDGRDDHDGGVYRGKPGDKRFALRLFLRGVLHQIENAADGGFPELLGNPHRQNAGLIHTAAQDLLSLLYGAGHALPGQGAGIQQGGALFHHAVQRHPLAGAHQNPVAGVHLKGVHRDRFVPLKPGGGIRADIHQLADGAAGFLHGVVLEQLAHLIEQHDGDGLAVLAHEKGADRGKGHQEIFVKYLAADDVPQGLPHDVPADDRVGSQLQ